MYRVRELELCVYVYGADAVLKSWLVESFFANWSSLGNELPRGGT